MRPSGLLAAGWGVTGWVIVSRQPSEHAGWLFCIGAATVGGRTRATAYTIYGGSAGSSPLPGQGPSRSSPITLPSSSRPIPPPSSCCSPTDIRPAPDGDGPCGSLLAGIGVAAIAYALTPGPAQQLRGLRDLVREPVGCRRVRRGTPGQRRSSASARLMIIGAGLGDGRRRLAAVPDGPAARAPAAALAGRRSPPSRAPASEWILVLGPLAGLLGLDEAGGGDVTLSPSWPCRPRSPSSCGIPAAYLVAIFKHGLWDLDVVIKEGAWSRLVLTLVIVERRARPRSPMLGRSALLDGDRTDVVDRHRRRPRDLAAPALVGRRLAQRVVYGRRRGAVPGAERGFRASARPTRPRTCCPGWRGSSARAPEQIGARCGFGSATNSAPRPDGRRNSPSRGAVPLRGGELPVRRRGDASSRSATAASCSGRSRSRCRRATR